MRVGLKHFFWGGTMGFKSLLDPSFTYRNSASTDVSLTFARVRREQEEARRRPGRDTEKVIAIIGNPLQPPALARSQGAERR